MRTKLHYGVLLFFITTHIAFCQTTVVSYTTFNSWSATSGGDSNGYTNAAYLQQTSDGGCAYAVFTSPVFSTVGYENLFIYADIINNKSSTFIRIEYSANGGTNWYPLGSSGEGINWYNSTTGCHSNNSGQQGWEGVMTQTGILYCLNSSLSNNPNARLRVFIDMWNDGGYARLDNLILKGSGITSEDLSSGPGGITSGLKTWLRTDKEVPYFSDGNAMDTWDDKVKNNSAFAELAADSPTFYNNPTENINFNPVIDFDGTQSLRSCAGLYTQDIFVVTQPSTTISNASSASYVLGFDDETVTYPSVDISGIHFGNTGSKFTNEVFSYNLATSSSGYAVAQIGSSSFDNTCLINAGNNAGSNGMDLYVDGNLLATSEVNTASFKNVNDTKYWLAKGEASAPNYSGKITEVISFSSRLGATDRQKVESYLGIKYGITLGTNGISKNYLDSGNNVIWNVADASSAGSFNYDIFGIGRDDNSSLEQKQSKSINTGSLLTIGLDDIAETNSANPNNFLNDKSFTLIANNGLDLNTNYSSTFDLGYVQPPYTAFDKKWRLSEFGDVGTIKIKIAASEITSNLTLSGSEEYIILMADDSDFTSNVSVEFLGLSGTNYEAKINSPSNKVRYFTFGKAPLHYSKAHADFDGIDDYLEGNGLMAGYNDSTIMGWTKLDTGFGSEGIIFGQEMFNIGIDSSLYPFVKVINNTSSSPVKLTSTNVISKDIWTHVAASYNGTNGELKLYINGELKVQTSVAIGTLSTNVMVDGKLQIGGLNESDFLKGNIDELRVFNTTLSQDQIQKIIYQEVENNGGNLKGDIIPKDVEGLAWSSLKAYYRLNDYQAVSVVDWINFDKALFKNFNTSNATYIQSAPMPFETSSNGDWSNSSVWSQNTIWDIHSIDEKDWAIVKVNNDITSSISHSTLGLFVDSGKTFTVNGDNEINNSWYLELNGSLDLADDSQLVQGINSDLVTGSNGKILRRQDGSSNVYWYTYMSSPVGMMGVTTLTNNNAATNNANNSAFQFNTLKEGDGSLVQFTSAYNEVGKMSTRWMYTFQNGLTYYDWAHYSPSTSLDPGVGYIHKGLGNPGIEQEYIFEGKPNNGTILIAADDVDGDSGNESQPDVTLTSTLIGNPYPSAIDAHQFIDDNAGIIEGTLYLWQQWAGDNHILREYEGGYAVLNKMAKIKAYQFDGLSGANNGFQNGTKAPTRYLAVGQAFMTEVIADGNIEFNNGQRIFKKEANGETVFFRGAESNQDTKAKGEKEEIELMRLDFTTSNGLNREIVLGFSNFTTEGYDYGYDAKMFETKSEDMFTMWKGHDMIAQAYPSIHPTNKIPLGLNVTGNHTYKIKATAFENFKANQNVYLHDKYTNTYFDLRSKEAYGFTSERGRIEDRFEIVFKANHAKKDLEVIIDNTLIYYNTSSDKLFVKGLETNAQVLSLVNMLGQAVMTQKEVSKEALTQGIHISDLSTGVYIVQITTADLQNIEKKIIID